MSMRDPVEMQLHIHVSRLHERAAHVFVQAPASVDVVVAHLMGQLNAGDSRAAHLIATQVLDTYADSSFWRTALGQRIASIIGYPEPIVPQAAAAAILGVSIQRIGQLAARITLNAEYVRLRWHVRHGSRQAS